MVQHRVMCRMAIPVVFSWRFRRVSTGDILTLMCSMAFGIQIMLISHYAQQVGALKLTFLEFLTEAVLATFFMLVLENPQFGSLKKAWVAIAYTGIMSRAVGYSLQAAGAEGLNPAVASLAMSMQSVFSAIGGRLIFHETLTPTEVSGCVLMFAAIVFAEMPAGNLSLALKNVWRKISS